MKAKNKNIYANTEIIIILTGNDIVERRGETAIAEYNPPRVPYTLT